MSNDITMYMMIPWRESVEHERKKRQSAKEKECKKVETKVVVAKYKSCRSCSMKVHIEESASFQPVSIGEEIKKWKALREVQGDRSRSIFPFTSWFSYTYIFRTIYL